MTESLQFVPDSDTVDANNPWPGLAAFREADTTFFRGREEETAQLLDFVLWERVTVLFGASGLGKTSLLQAGLFPQLRLRRILPVPIRFDFREEAPSLRRQVLDALAREAGDHSIEIPIAQDDDTLWERFHREDADLWDTDNEIVVPLLVFDQFEEVFTLGQKRSELTRKFLEELADLTEGRPSEEVRKRLENDRDDARAFSLERHPYKILFCLRSDFLDAFEGLREQMRSIIYNRLPLRPMNGSNALRVVQVGAHLLDHRADADQEVKVDERIVRFVGGQEDETRPLASIEIEPALLSLVCRELSKRRTESQPLISFDLVRGNRDEIISNFYDDSLRGLGANVRRFVEEQLLTSSGHRNYVAQDDALLNPGVNEQVLQLLIDRRLLRIEPRGSVPRVELTHDVLVRAIRISRDARRHREARTKLNQSWRTILIQQMLLIALVALATWGIRAEGRARLALGNAYLEKAPGTSDPRAALTWLAAAVKTDPNNSLARHRLAFELIHRSWPIPYLEIREQPLALSPSGRFVATRSSSGEIRVWDLVSQKALGRPFQTENLKVDDVSLSQDGLRLLIRTGPSAGVWDVQAGTLLVRLPQGAIFFDLSPQGNQVVFHSPRHVHLWELSTGKVTNLPEASSSGFSPDGRFLWTQSRDILEIVEVRTGRSLYKISSLGSLLYAPAFNSDGSQFLTWWFNRGQVWDTASGKVVGTLEIEEEDWFSSAHFRHDGREILTISSNSVRIWETVSGSWRTTFQINTQEIVHSAQLSQDGRWLLTQHSHRARIWDTRSAAPISTAFPATSAAFLGETDRVVALTLNRAVAWRVALVDSPVIFRPPGNVIALVPDRHQLLSYEGDHLRLDDLQTGQLLRHLENSSLEGIDNLNVQVADSGDFVGLITQGGLRVWDLRTGRLVTPRPVKPERDDIRTTFLSPDGKYVASSAISGLIIREVASGHRTATLPVPPFAQARFSRIGGSIITVMPFEASLWDPRTGHQESGPWRYEEISKADISRDGDRVALGDRAGVARVLHLRTGSILAGPFQHPNSVDLIQFDATSRRLLTAAGGFVRIWDTVTRTVQGEELPVSEGISAARFSPDGSRAVLVLDSGAALLLDTLSGRPISLPSRLTSDLIDADFSPDNHTLRLTTREAVYLWDIPSLPTTEATQLARFAEAIAGSTIDEQGHLSELESPVTILAELRRKTANAPWGQANSASLIHWFLSDPQTRTISPFSKRTRTAEAPSH